MRIASEFHCRCICGAQIVTATSETICQSCKQPCRIDWPAQLEQVKAKLETQAA